MIHMIPTFSPLTAALWSVAIPGFGQLYNRKLAKGLVFIVLEFLINVNSHLNSAIFYSWTFDISRAQSILNYDWLLFYPCMYVFAIFDAYHDGCRAIGHTYPKLLPVPFFATCFIGTIGLSLSSGAVHVVVLEQLGPVFMGAILLLLGLGIGSWAVYRYTPGPPPQL